MDFRFSEFTKSDIAKRKHIINAITSWDVRDNIIALVENLLQPARDAWGKAITINSGFRCAALNEEVGGVPTSQHCLGQAADCGVDNPLAFARMILELGLPFDQMGIYPTFVHLSYKDEGKNRGEIFYSANYKGERL